MELDDTVGNIMAALKSNGVDNNTLVLVTGDGRFQRAAFDSKGKWKTTVYHKIGSAFTDDDEEGVLMKEDEDSVVVRGDGGKVDR